MGEYEKLALLVQKGQIDGIQEAVEELLAQEKPPSDIIEKGVIVALDIVGKGFSEGNLFIPEMLVAARASQKVLDILKPLLLEEKTEPRGKVVIGTVKGDLHDIGKNIVSTVFESAGFQVTDLGIDVAPDKFIQAIRDVEPEIVAMSCLLTTTMDSMRLTIDEIAKEQLRDGITILVGGPPISEKYAKEIGADFYGKNAYTGVQIARKCVEN
jgi:5-methyltetrahydrofolate--homocysteine methyltransferase